jgi:hypothetical protein
MLFQMSPHVLPGLKLNGVNAAAIGEDHLLHYIYLFVKQIYQVTLVVHAVFVSAGDYERDSNVVDAARLLHSATRPCTRIHSTYRLIRSGPKWLMN